MVQIVIAAVPGIARDGLKTILEKDDSISVCGVASCVHEILEMCAEKTPDLIIMDIEMLGAAETIRREFPKIKVVILTDAKDYQTISMAFSCSVDGYILKNIREENLISVIKNISDGYCVFDPNIKDVIRGAVSSSNRVFSGAIENLDDRDKDMLIYISQGKSNHEIAELTFLSNGRVKNRVTELMRMFGVENRTQLAGVLFRQYPNLESTLYLKHES